MRLGKAYHVATYRKQYYNGDVCHFVMRTNSKSIVRYIGVDLN